MTKPKKFPARYPQEGFSGIHLQLMRSYDIEYCLQIGYVITFGTAFHCNVVDVAFHYFMHVFMENCIHSSLICCPHVLQSEGHDSITIYPQWHPDILRIHP